MLIKQIIEFELRGPGAPVILHVELLLKLVIFMAKQKSPSQLFQ